ncbi:Uma2 family endonuclease [Streptomyces sp. NPDC056910]|uniref:Uma2 family endonuclease n=1 Tax=Streptomyces sp. NPDC056910 TaxID=3345964 RepID=UPI0036C8369E
MLRIRRLLEQRIPNGPVAHTRSHLRGGRAQPDPAPTGRHRARRGRHGGQGASDPRTPLAAIEVESHSNPDNDWASKMRDYPLIGIPVYAIFDPRTGSGAVPGRHPHNAGRPPLPLTHTPHPERSHTVPARSRSHNVILIVPLLG